MALHKVDPSIVKSKNNYIRDMLKEFDASDMDCARVDIPEGSSPKNFRTSAYTQLKNLNLQDKIKIRFVEGNVYFLKNGAMAVLDACELGGDAE